MTTNAAGEVCLHLQAGPKTAASWRTRAVLRAGAYRFTALARTESVQSPGYGRNQGAFLEVRGAPGVGSTRLQGSSDWTALQAAFTASKETEVELLCVLRAAGGEAWFRCDSLRLSRIEENSR